MAVPTLGDVIEGTRRPGARQPQRMEQPYRLGILGYLMDGADSLRDEVLITRLSEPMMRGTKCGDGGCHDKLRASRWRRRHSPQGIPQGRYTLDNSLRIRVHG